MPKHQAHVTTKARKQRFIYVFRPAIVSSGQSTSVLEPGVTVMRKPTPLGEALKLGAIDRSRELVHEQPGYDAVYSMITDGILVPFLPSTRSYHRMACCCLACVPGEPALRDGSVCVGAGTDRGQLTFTQIFLFGHLLDSGRPRARQLAKRGDCQRMLLGLGRVLVQAVSPSSKVRYCIPPPPISIYLWKQARFEKRSAVYRTRIGRRDSCLGPTRHSVRVVFLPETRGKPRDEPALCVELCNALTQQTPGIADLDELDQNRSPFWRSGFISPPARDNK